MRSGPFPGCSKCKPRRLSPTPTGGARHVLSMISGDICDPRHRPWQDTEATQTFVSSLLLLRVASSPQDQPQPPGMSTCYDEGEVSQNKLSICSSQWAERITPKAGVFVAENCLYITQPSVAFWLQMNKKPSGRKSGQLKSKAQFSTHPA